MREINFRIWCKQREEMFIVKNIEIHDENLLEVYEHDQNLPFYLELDDKNNDGFLMEYTGLRDKNGVKIYERDIVKCFKEYLSVVIFKESTFGLMSNGIFTPFFELGGFCEVLGNKFENPELLK